MTQQTPAPTTPVAPDAQLLAAARGRAGLHAGRRGTRPVRRGAGHRRRRPAAGGRQLAGQVGAVPGRRGAPRAAGRWSPSTTTAAPRSTSPAGSTTTRRWSTREVGRIDTLPGFRRTVAVAGAEDVVVAVVDPLGDARRRCGHPAGAPLPRRQPHRGVRPAATWTPGCRSWPSAACSPSTTSSPTRPTAGRRRTACTPDALATGEFTELPGTGSLRLLRRDHAPPDRQRRAARRGRRAGTGLA